MLFDETLAANGAMPEAVKRLKGWWRNRGARLRVARGGKTLRTFCLPLGMMVFVLAELGRMAALKK